MEAPQIASTPRTDVDTIPKTVDELRRVFHRGHTRSLEWRRDQLRRFVTMVKDREDVFVQALREDLGKPAFEAWIGETGFLVNEAEHAIKHLAKWMKPQKVKTPLVNQPGKSYVMREPLGVVLIIGPWNYPVQLVLSPLVGAISAGNCAVLKPSEVAPASSAAMAEWVPKYLDEEAIKVIEGGVPETQALLDQRFDHIFYTGGGTVGRIVMQAAAKHLTPVTLELGGKSPAIVDRDVDLDVTAKRIVWGRYFNAGQTCVAPDYVLVHQDVEKPLLDKLASTIRDFYGDDPRQSPDYARIINERHHQRLSSLLSDGKPVVGGQTDEGERYIAPTVLSEVDPDSKVMQDEIFGPILPVLPVKSVDEAIDFVYARPKPLALYVFTKNRNVSQRVLENTSSGGACVNDVVAHLSVPGLPFGGVGDSGTGAYHGEHSFETFSHRKSVLDKSTKMDPPVRYPPYTDDKVKWAKRLV